MEAGDLKRWKDFLQIIWRLPGAEKRKKGEIFRSRAIRNQNLLHRNAMGSQLGI